MHEAAAVVKRCQQLQSYMARQRCQRPPLSGSAEMGCIQSLDVQVVVVAGESLESGAAVAARRWLRRAAKLTCALSAACIHPGVQQVMRRSAAALLQADGAGPEPWRHCCRW